MYICVYMCMCLCELVYGLSECVSNGVGVCVYVLACLYLSGCECMDVCMCLCECM